MGAIAEVFAAYAQPLLDQTDGSQEQLNKAFAISQLCYNLALLPEASREEMLSKMRLSLQMDDDEFDGFTRSVVLPMIRRHQVMFPQLHSLCSTGFFQNDASPSASAPRTRMRTAAAARPYAGTAPYAPCPCNSGRKYKFCCGKRVH